MQPSLRRLVSSAFLGIAAVAGAGAVAAAPAHADVPGVWIESQDVRLPGCRTSQHNLAYDFTPGQVPALQGNLVAWRGCRGGATVSVTLLQGVDGLAPVVVDREVQTVPYAPFPKNGLYAGAEAIGWTPRADGFVQVNTQVCFQGECSPVYWIRLTGTGRTFTKGSV